MFTRIWARCPQRVHFQIRKKNTKQDAFEKKLYNGRGVILYWIISWAMGAQVYKHVRGKRWQGGPMSTQKKKKPTENTEKKTYTFLRCLYMLCFYVSKQKLRLKNYQNKLPADGSASTKKRAASPHSQDVSFGLKSQGLPAAQRQPNADMQKRPIQQHILRRQVKLTAPTHCSKRPTIDRKERVDTVSECYRLAQRKWEILDLPSPCSLWERKEKLLLQLHFSSTPYYCQALLKKSNALLFKIYAVSSFPHSLFALRRVL